MGFANREGGKYFNIMDGKFTIRVQEGTPGAVARVNKKGVTVHEVHHDSFEAKLVDIRTKDSPYGKNWEFDFQDGGEIYTLQLSFSNSYATAFLKILPNIDLTKPMKLQPSAKKDADGKTKSSLFVSQDGVTLKHAYTKDNPNGLPNMEQIMVKGVPTWDDTKRLEFLQAMVEKDIKPKLPGTPKSAVPTTGSATQEDLDEVFGSDDTTAGGDDDF